MADTMASLFLVKYVFLFFSFRSVEDVPVVSTVAMGFLQHPITIPITIAITMGASYVLTSPPPLSMSPLAPSDFTCHFSEAISLDGGPDSRLLSGHRVDRVLPPSSIFTNP
jgi:hypothetical protein